MQELTARGIIDLRNVPGTANHADALTKHVAPKSVFREYMSRIYQVDAARYTALHREQPEQVRPVDAEVTVAPGAPRLRPTAQLLASVGGREDQLPSLRRPAAHAALLAARLVREHPSAAAFAALLAARLAREHPPAYADDPASPIRCEDAEGNLVASLAPAALLERQDLAEALVLLASQPPPLPRPVPTPCLMGAVIWGVLFKLFCNAPLMPVRSRRETVASVHAAVLDVNFVEGPNLPAPSPRASGASHMLVGPCHTLRPLDPRGGEDFAEFTPDARWKSRRGFGLSG